MKITGKLPNATQNAEAAKGTAQSSKLGGAAALGTGEKTNKVSSSEIGQSARVDVSQRAQDIRKAKELATPSNDVDEAKVARLQALIDSGKYKVDADAIADRLLDEQMKMSN